MVRRLHERENTFFSIIAAPLRSQYPGWENRSMKGGKWAERTTLNALRPALALGTTVTATYGELGRRAAVLLLSKW